MFKAKPFIKWVGGKTQLIEQLEAQLPADFDNWENATYIEPFVGGGAMLFYMLQRYPRIQHAIINDINSDLCTCYQTVRDLPEQLIEALYEIENTYRDLKTEEERKLFFLNMRERYNQKDLKAVENTTLFFFLNRTCFNGLYRVNKRGLSMFPLGNTQILLFAILIPFEEIANCYNGLRLSMLTLRQHLTMLKARLSFILTHPIVL